MRGLGWKDRGNCWQHFGLDFFRVFKKIKKQTEKAEKQQKKKGKYSENEEEEKQTPGKLSQCPAGSVAFWINVINLQDRKC